MSYTRSNKLCWYCNYRVAEQKNSVTLYKEDRVRQINIPRCRDCQRTKNTIDNYSSVESLLYLFSSIFLLALVGAAIISVGILILPLLAFVLSGASIVTIAFIICTISLGILALCCAVGRRIGKSIFDRMFGKTVQQLQASMRFKYADSAQYPGSRIQQLFEEGWSTEAPPVDNNPALYG